MELWCWHRIAALYISLIGFLARLTLVLVALFAALMAIMRLPPIDHTAYLDFFACDPQPCWREIVPGVTVEEDALAYLERDPLIDTVPSVNSYGFDRWYSWQWNASYPANKPAIGVWQGGIYFDTKYGEGDVVERLFLSTTLRVGEVWNKLSAPDEFLMLFSFNGSNSVANMDIRYDTLNVMTSFPSCPITFVQLLRQPTSMWLNADVVALTVIHPETNPRRMRDIIIDANRRTC